MKVEFKKVKLKDAIKLKTYKIKNHDSGKTYKVKAKSFNDAKDKYNKMIVNDGKFVEVSEKYLSKFVSEIEKIGFKVDNKGTTWSGAIHYQIITKTVNNDEFTLKKMAQALSKISRLFFETYNIPVTYNVGLQTDGYISAGVDLRKQYVKDSFETDDEITNIVKQVKSKFDVSVTFKSDKNSQTLEITDWNENETAKLKQYINQQLSNIDNFNKKGTNENDSLVWSWKKENVKDSTFKDALSHYLETNQTRMKTLWQNKDVYEKRYKVQITRLGVGNYVEGTRGNIKKLLKEIYGSNFNADPFIHDSIKDSLTEDDEMAGWIAIYNGTRIEIKKSEASSLYAAKKLAILKFKEKFKNVKEHMISIAPGYEDSLTEDAEKYRGFKLYKNGTDWEVESSDGTQWNYDGSMSLQEVKKAIDKGLRTGNWDDSLTEDAEKSMGTYMGYSIKQNVDGDIYVLKKSGEKQFFESWKKAYEAIKTGAIKDSITEDADSLAKWKAIGGQIESLFKRYVDKKVGNTVIDRVYRDISVPYADELTFGVSSNIDFAQKDITSLINSHKQDIERIYLKKLVEVKMLRSSNAAKNQVASITFSLKFDGNIWKDSHPLKTYKIKNNDSGKTYKVKAKSFNDAKDKYNKFISIDSLTEDATLTDFQKLKRYIMEDDMYIYNETSTSFSYRDYRSKDNSGTMKLENGVLVAYDKNSKKVNSWKSFDEYKNETFSDSLTEDADIAQNDIKSSYLPEDANAENIKYLGFNELRKISFYQYGDNFYAHYDLTGAVEKIDKDAVQRILKKNIIGEIDEDILTQKQSKNEEIVKDSDYERYTLKTGRRSDAFKQYLRDRGLKFEPSQNGNYTEFVVFNADESVDRRVDEIIKTVSDSTTERGDK